MAAISDRKMEIAEKISSCGLFIPVSSANERDLYGRSSLCFSGVTDNHLIMLPTTAASIWVNTYIYFSQTFRISITHLIQSPCFMTSNAPLISGRDFLCVMNSSTFNLPCK